MKFTGVIFFLLISFVGAIPATNQASSNDTFMVTDLDPHHYKGYWIDYTNELLSVKRHDNFNIVEDYHKDIPDDLIKRDAKEIDTHTFWNEEHLMQYPQVLDNKLNVIILKEEREIMYYSEEDQTWISHQFDSNVHDGVDKDKTLVPFYNETLVPYHDLIPVTSCLSNEFGSGGSVSRQYSFNLQASNTAGFGFTVSVFFTSFGLGLDMGIGTTTTVNFSSSYSCDIAAGEIGQLFVQPFMVEYPQSHRRVMRINKRLRKIFRGRDIEMIERFRMIALVKPNHYCISEKDESKLSCGSTVGGTIEYKTEIE
ncbi:hypothetical protein DFJ63DRAFT_22563 [Scheffersomyces coipomensis]|uniref:uncharacterized protein n=1 Tax=Scheffersomyces coipomensis TaxID=1788519 RepID=UPI00315DC963